MKRTIIPDEERLRLHDHMRSGTSFSEEDTAIARALLQWYADTLENARDALEEIWLADDEGEHDEDRANKYQDMARKAAKEIQPHAETRILI